MSALWAGLQPRSRPTCLLCSNTKDTVLDTDKFKGTAILLPQYPGLPDPNVRHIAGKAGGSSVASSGIESDSSK